MEKPYEEQVAERESAERDMRNRIRMDEIKKYGTDPYHDNIIKNGTYEELQAIQIECDKRLRATLAQMTSLQDQVTELVNTQKRIQAALAINKPQNKVDGYTMKEREEDEGR